MAHSAPPETLPPFVQLAAAPTRSGAGSMAALVRQALLALLAVAGALSAAGSMMLAPGVRPAPGALPLALVLIGHGALVLASLWAWRRPPAAAPLSPAPWRLEASLPAGAVVLAGLSGAWLGWQAVLLAMPMVLVGLCLLAQTVERRWAGLGIVAAWVLGLAGAWAEQQGWLPQAGAAAWLAPVLISAAALVAVWLGWLLRSLSRQQRLLAMRQAQRWQAMRRMSTDVCWETDATLRIRSLAWRNRHGRLMPVTDEYLGQRPWEMPVLSMDDEVLDLLRVNVDGRDRIEDLAMAWRCPDGRRRHYLVSGEPGFDAAGRFCGYWGVARDVSAERTARLSMQGAARRYQRLFLHMPVPMLVHRDGRILEANAAAAALLGYAQPEAMPGHDLLEEHMDDEQRDMALERLDDLDADPSLEALPAVPRRLLRCDGEPVYTLATGLRTDHAGHPAMLAIYLDESARHAALQVQHRSESLLTRVLSLIPDLVALCALDSGRCVLVNDGLGRLLGLGRSQWMGPGAPGPWTQRAVFDQLVASAQAQGGVRDQPVTFAAADGSSRLLLVSATLVALDDGRYLLMNARPAAGAGPGPLGSPTREDALA